LTAATLDREDVRVHAQDRLDVAVLVGHVASRSCTSYLGAASRKGASRAATLNSAWKRCANTMTRPSRVGSSRAAKLAPSVEKSIANGDHWCRSRCS
jgi:hypothetical protein